MAGLALALGALMGPAALKSPAALSIAKTKTAGRSLHAGSDGPAQFAEPGFPASPPPARTRLRRTASRRAASSSAWGRWRRVGPDRRLVRVALPRLHGDDDRAHRALDATHEHEEGSGDAAAAEEPLDLSLVCSVYNGCGASFFNGVLSLRRADRGGGRRLRPRQHRDDMRSDVLRAPPPAIPRARLTGAPPAPRRRPPPAQTAAMDFAINLADGGAGGSVATGMCDCRAACGLGDYKNDMSICTGGVVRRPLAA